mmetsp:Transcript_8429/g.25341  ORF Transcript_8429/g.25341 Transcript_8429/m.25341 type:complete len:365 (+) Transcript_8429:189-1283(+)
MGKNASASRAWMLNSSVPERFDESISSSCQSSTSDLGSWWCAPAISTISGVAAQPGILIDTPYSSMSRGMLYSMFTFIIPPPSSSGQQLTVSGTSCSSVVLSDQRTTPTGRPTGKPLPAPFMTTTPSDSQSFLETLGCTAKVVPAATALSATASLQSEAASSFAVSESVPLRSKASTTPSCDSCSESFSSTVREMGWLSVGGGAAAAAVGGAGIDGAKVSTFRPSSAAIFDMRSVLPFFLPPSFMDCTMRTGSGSGGGGTEYASWKAWRPGVPGGPPLPGLPKGESAYGSASSGAAPPPMPAMPPAWSPVLAASRCRCLMTCDMCFAWSLAVSIFVFLTMLWSFSSCESMSRFWRMVRMSIDSR